MKFTLNKKMTTEQGLENLYLIVFAVFVAYNFLLTTMFKIMWSDSFYNTIIILLIVIILAKICLSEKYSIKETLVCIALVFICLMAWKQSGYNEVYYLLLLILGCHGIDADKIIKVYFGVCFVLLLITIGAALTGQIENLVYHQAGRRTRMALGICYPTDFSAHVLYLVVCYVFLRRKVLKVWVCTIPFIFGTLIYALCEARLNTICLFLLGMGMFVIWLWKQKNLKSNFITRWSSYLATVSVPLCALGMICLTMIYSPNSRIMGKMNQILNNRLSYGKQALQLNDITLWGQYIEMQGNGSTTKDQLNYFFIDSSYVKALLCYGFAVLICIVIILAIMSCKAWQRKEWIFVWCIAIVALQCVIEHHIIEVAYNPFLLLALANFPSEKQKETIS